MFDTLGENILLWGILVVILVLLIYLFMRDKYYDELLRRIETAKKIDNWIDAIKSIIGYVNKNKNTKEHLDTKIKHYLNKYTLEGEDTPWELLDTAAEQGIRYAADDLVKIKEDDIWNNESFQWGFRGMNYEDAMQGVVKGLIKSPTETGHDEFDDE